MKYDLGFKLVHPIDGESEGYIKVIAVRENAEATWQIDPEHSEDEDTLEFLEDTLANEVLLGQRDWDATLMTVEEMEDDYDYEVTTNWRDFISVEEYNRRQDVSNKIVAILQSHGLDTNDLIVSDGKVYQGYSECASYIQNSYAWCSSSMSC